MVLTEVRKLEDHFESLNIHHVSRDNNVVADVLSKLGSKHALVPASPSDVPGSRDVLMTEAKDDSHQDFIAYFEENCIPDDKVDREKIVWCAAFIGPDFWDFCGGPPTVQRPSRASKQHGASSRQRPHLLRRFAIRD
jgi:hypothetical protein